MKPIDKVKTLCYNIGERNERASLKYIRREYCKHAIYLIMKDRQKIKLFIDADDTILESSKAAINILNERFGLVPQKTYDDMKDWGYRSIYHQCTNKIVNEIYDSELFFNIVKIHPDFMKFYNLHKNDFEWYIVTKGHYENIKKKKEYFSKHLPSAIVIGCQFKSLENEEYDKSHINMNYGIQIDDRTDCLTGTNANIKILFKNNKDFYWNQTNKTKETLYKMNTWKEIVETLEFALKNPEVFMEGVN